MHSYFVYNKCVYLFKCAIIIRRCYIYSDRTICLRYLYIIHKIKGVGAVIS